MSSASSELSDEPSREQRRRARAKKSATDLHAALSQHIKKHDDLRFLGGRPSDDDEVQIIGFVRGAHHPVSHPKGSLKPFPEAHFTSARKASVRAMKPSGGLKSLK